MIQLFSLGGGEWLMLKMFFQIIYEVHATSKGHIGTKKTLEEVGKLYDCVPRSAIGMYMCPCAWYVT